MTETTTEQLVEIEGQSEDTPATGYIPPEGWRVLAVGEILQAGDMWVNHEGEWRTRRVGETVNDERYIRPIEPQAEPVPDTELQAQVAFLKGREVTLGTRLQQEREVTTRLRGELESVQKLLGTETRRVAELEELVASLRTINVTQEKAFTAAGRENTALKNQLAAVKAELVTQAETSRRLQIELDAAQQVPADSPELRQLRADLEQVTRDRDTYRDGYDWVLSDLRTMRETAKAEAVEAIVEWLVPIRTCGSPALATAVIINLPHIMRHLTGLEDEGIE